MANAGVIFVLGGPGCGKGTQCERIVEKYGWQHFSSGDILRNEVQAATDLGNKVNEYMQQGALVPDETMIEVVKSAMQKNMKPFILLDGFPRTIPQVQLFEKQVKPCMAVLYFAADDVTLKQRLLGRGRSDDTEEAVKNRLVVYREQTMPVITHFMKQGKVIQINASHSADEVFNEVSYNLDEALREQENEVREQESVPQEGDTKPTDGEQSDTPPKMSIVGLLRNASKRLSRKKL